MAWSLLLALSLPSISGQGNGSGSEYVRPGVSSALVEESVKIDGWLDEACWQRAGRITDFRQVEPNENAAPSERTLVLLCHNRHNLYIGIYCYDSNPAGIRATQMERDANLDPDDRMEIIIDTFRSHRNAYFLQIGPGESVGDGLIGENGRRFSKPWDGIFHGKSRITKDGWQAELAVPMTTVRFDPKQTTWGINFNRHIRRKSEQVRWANPFRHLRFFKPSVSGDLRGMVGLEQAAGISLKPYAVTSSNYSKERGTHTSADFGGDLFISLTPSLTGVFTFNTDFAEAEADSRQINLTRFPLFFPEKRDFFLEAAPNFDFGFGRRDVLPFHSRRIGRDDEGRPLPLYGGKLVGRAGDYGIGVLAMHTEPHGGVPHQEMGVARFTKSLGEQSLIGLIGTVGNPTADEDNMVTGLDFDLGTSKFMNNKNLSLRGYGLHSRTQGMAGRDMAFGSSLEFGQEPVSANFKCEEIQENFNPELGFVSRRGIRRYSSGFTYTRRPGGNIRKIRHSVSGSMVTTNTNGMVEESNGSLTPLDLTFESGDRFRFSLHGKREDLEESFEISEDIFITPGRYETWMGALRWTTSDKRPLAYHAHFDYGTLYSGWYTRYAAGCSLRVSNLLQAFCSYDQRDVRLDEGDFTVRLASLRATVTPIRPLAWNVLIQYDNVSDSLGVNSRLRWLLAEGNDVHFIFNYGWEASHEHFHREDNNLTLKVGWTFQF